MCSPHESGFRQQERFSERLMRQDGVMLTLMLYLDHIMDKLELHVLYLSRCYNSCPQSMSMSVCRCHTSHSHVPSYMQHHMHTSHLHPRTSNFPIPFVSTLMSSSPHGQTIAIKTCNTSSYRVVFRVFRVYEAQRGERTSRKVKTDMSTSFSRGQTLRIFRHLDDKLLFSNL